MRCVVAVVETMDYFRAILARNELSPRSVSHQSHHGTCTQQSLAAPLIVLCSSTSVTAVLCSALALTADVIEQNSANYTAWAYRRRCLLALHCSLSDELQFAERIAFHTPKNYQLWHHRRAILHIVDQPGHELQHTVSTAH